MTQKPSTPPAAAEARKGAATLSMPKLTIAALALLVAGLGVVSEVRRSNRRSRQALAPPVPAKAVDLSRYLGRWYEFARYDSWFEHHDEGVTAEYSLRPDGLIRVVNTSRSGSPTGRQRRAEARARVVPGSGNARLKVSFFGPFFVGNYWVLDYAEDYSWSIVGEGSRRYLWILTRASIPEPELGAMLIDRVRSLGYDTTILHLTQQPPG